MKRAAMSAVPIHQWDGASLLPPGPQRLCARVGRRPPRSGPLGRAGRAAQALAPRGGVDDRGYSITALAGARP